MFWNLEFKYRTVTWNRNVCPFASSPGCDRQPFTNRPCQACVKTGPQTICHLSMRPRYHNGQILYNRSKTSKMNGMTRSPRCIVMGDGGGGHQFRRFQFQNATKIRSTYMIEIARAVRHDSNHKDWSISPTPLFASHETKLKQNWNQKQCLRVRVLVYIPRKNRKLQTLFYDCISCTKLVEKMFWRRQTFDERKNGWDEMWQFSVFQFAVTHTTKAWHYNKSKHQIDTHNINTHFHFLSSREKELIIFVSTKSKHPTHNSLSLSRQRHSTNDIISNISNHGET